MKVSKIASETTHFMTVVFPDGIEHECIRTPFGEWCFEENFGIITELRRLPGDVARKLEEAYQEYTSI